MDPDTVACQKIIDAKSPFDCFEMPARETDPSTVRSIYLKIAVRVHPDKNTSHLATQAFQILSESFEVLHDEDKQLDLLQHPPTSSSSWRRAKKKKKKRKPSDIADLVHQNDKWYTRDWKEVEVEIERMTTEFKEHLAKKQEKHERQLEKRAEKRERKNKRIKKNLNFLYEKYGIDPSDSDSDEEKNTYNYVSYIPETVPEECPSLEDTDRTNTEANSAEAPSTSTSSKSKDSICRLCRRSFTSDAMLQVHYEKSELHRSNVEKAANPWHKFKNSFSEVKDP